MNALGCFEFSIKKIIIESLHQSVFRSSPTRYRIFFIVLGQSIVSSDYILRSGILHGPMGGAHHNTLNQFWPQQPSVQICYFFMPFFRTTNALFSGKSGSFLCAHLQSSPKVSPSLAHNVLVVRQPFVRKPRLRDLSSSVTHIAIGGIHRNQCRGLLRAKTRSLRACTRARLPQGNLTVSAAGRRCCLRGHILLLQSTGRASSQTRTTFFKQKRKEAVHRRASLLLAKIRICRGRCWETHCGYGRAGHTFSSRRWSMKREQRRGVHFRQGRPTLLQSWNELRHVEIQSRENSAHSFDGLKCRFKQLQQGGIIRANNKL